MMYSSVVVRFAVNLWKASLNERLEARGKTGPRRGVYVVAWAVTAREANTALFMLAIIVCLCCI